MKKEMDGGGAGTTYQALYSEEHKRDFYVDPATSTTSWYAPNVSIQNNDEGVEASKGAEISKEETEEAAGSSSNVDTGGRLAMYLAVVVLLLALHAWTKLWMPEKEGLWPTIVLKAFTPTMVPLETPPTMVPLETRVTTMVPLKTPPTMVPLETHVTVVENSPRNGVVGNSKHGKNTKAIKRAGNFFFTPWVLLLKDPEELEAKDL
mmetsp:Transcript_8249/g.10802  ORF Transcript_8249/g.10802 Transcript_8249/m.10802 type:complete len:206 (+) Transcript_8249:320-937(+)|eukprot:CAMPEP_0198145250 /NCGR_PEP_ID=MMETSP1443-20131203/22218_1 /TAXON_ID=186043 /ORGANISM="Entomoneis sp., Strain CCMP2396" /LENGTH=205 /DNA_ID=CAMNT_0043808831 /DNA_START=256 /DNA_END=873 /DNA_ORIENTATION=+